MLLWCLNWLRHEFSQAAVVGENGERVPQKVLAPFFNGGGDGGELANIGRGVQELGEEGLAEKGDGVVLLRENDSHLDAGSISFDHEWQ